MILIRKLAPKRLMRAIVTLAAKSGNKLGGNKLVKSRNNDQTPGAARGEEFSHAVEDRGSRMMLSQRTTITVETERLLIVRRSSLAPEEPDVYSSGKK